MQVTTMEKRLTPEETAVFAAQFEQQDRFARAMSGMKWLALLVGVIFLALVWGSRK